MGAGAGVLTAVVVLGSSVALGTLRGCRWFIDDIGIDREGRRADPGHLAAAHRPGVDLRAVSRARAGCSHERFEGRLAGDRCLMGETVRERCQARFGVPLARP